MTLACCCRPVCPVPARDSFSIDPSEPPCQPTSPPSSVAVSQSLVRTSIFSSVTNPSCSKQLTTFSCSIICQRPLRRHSVRKTDDILTPEPNPNDETYFLHLRECARDGRLRPAGVGTDSQLVEPSTVGVEAGTTYSSTVSPVSTKTSVLSRLASKPVNGSSVPVYGSSPPIVQT